MSTEAEGARGPADGRRAVRMAAESLWPPSGAPGASEAPRRRGARPVDVLSARVEGLEAEFYYARLGFSMALLGLLVVLLLLLLRAHP